MNLVTEPWIPVIKPDGTHLLASLIDVFKQGREYSDLAVRPHERIALMRLLICIAQAALDGPNVAHWNAVPSRLPEAGVQYLKRWQESFDLFHPQKPFLQIATIEKPLKDGKADKGDGTDDMTPVSKLDFSLATGNNTTLFDHNGFSTSFRAFNSSSLALMLLTFQQFSPGGLIAKVQWKKTETSKSSGHAPCTPASMLHTFLRSNTLLDTVCVNLLSKETVQQHFNANGQERWGKPVWEVMPSSLDDKQAVENATQTYLGRLVPLSRLICLQTDGVGTLLGNGITYPAFPDFPAEAAATVFVNRKQERQLLGAGAKAIWRELSALIVSRKQGGEVGGALALANISEDVPFDIWVGALLTNKASILDTVESVFHIPASMQTDLGRRVYSEEVQWAEHIANKLSWAVESYREQSDGGWKGRVETTKPQDRWTLKEKLHGIATRHYWTAVEKERMKLMEHIAVLAMPSETDEQIDRALKAQQATLEVWKKAVRKAAYDAYRLACGQETPRQMRAFALGWGKLVGKPKAQANENEALETEVTEE